MRSENYRGFFFLLSLSSAGMLCDQEKQKNCILYKSTTLMLVSVKNKQSLFCPPETHMGFSYSSLREPRASISKVVTSKVLKLL